MPTSEALILAGGFGLLAIVQTVLCIYCITDARDTTRKAIDSIARTAESALILRGLNPNIVNPDLYGVTGMPRRDEEKHAPPTASARPSDELSEDELALRDAEAEYFRQQQGYDPITGARLGARPGAPPGANPAA